MVQQLLSHYYVGNAINYNGQIYIVQKVNIITVDHWSGYDFECSIPMLEMDIRNEIGEVLYGVDFPITTVVL